MKRPVIGVTTSRRSGWRIFPLVNLNLWLAGGRGLRWGAGRPADLDQVDGIIIGGGDDISPELYGGMAVIGVRLDPARDALERRLAEEALTRNIPILGICRGAQMLNVALGGNLDQDAWSTFGEAPHIRTILPDGASTCSTTPTWPVSPGRRTWMSTPCTRKRSTGWARACGCRPGINTA